MIRIRIAGRISEGVIRRKTYALGGLSKSVACDDLGNITANSGVGLYTYAVAGTWRPHAVITTSGGTLQSATSYASDAPFETPPCGGPSDEVAR